MKKEENEAAILKKYRKLPEDKRLYTEEEFVKAVEVFRLLQKMRNQLIAEGRWDPVKGCPIDRTKPKTSDDDSSKK